MSVYSSENLITSASRDEIPVDTASHYGFHEKTYNLAGKFPPDNERKESLFRFYKNLINTCNWTPLHFFEYLKNGDLRKTLDENGFEWVVLISDFF